MEMFYQTLTLLIGILFAIYFVESGIRKDNIVSICCLVFSFWFLFLYIFASKGAESKENREEEEK
jgi:uncharacterized protein (DUF486 family)